MVLDIQKLIASEFDMLNKLGWLLYNRDNQDCGLSKDELYKLLHIVNEEEIYKEYKTGYDEGLQDGVCQ